MKKIYILIIITLCCMISFTSVSINAESIETYEFDNSYIETLETAKDSLILDSEITELYEDSISVVDGKYVFEGEKYDENYDFINNNINIINS